ncbi:hypothetical protein HYR99_19775 [Candidatus Poribacteria bacterium]|nr:hypothetical protein [Candidatus Poribacteria bacterium]
MEEASQFWDEHTFLDYKDVEEVHFSVDLRKNCNFFDIDADLAKRIRRIARQQGVSGSQLVNQWLRERLLKDTKHVQ